jgi:hypothetical protein
MTIIIKHTHVETDTITLRVPVATQMEFTALRKLAKKADVDLTATLAEAIAAVFKTVRGEIEALDRKSSVHANGASKDA